MLAEKFIYSDDVESVLKLAVSTGKNVILWGPAGHGKSEMTAEFFKEQNPFVMSFGEDMDESKLWGGLDFKRLQDEKILQYQPERSFLAHEVAVFEEIFDAPASVLLSLKDTLTARELRKGEQRFPMKTRIIVGVTNKDPTEIESLGPAAAALIERFPLQLKVEWQEYKCSSYRHLFQHVGTSALDNDGISSLSSLIESANKMLAHPISPRVALHALNVIEDAMTAGVAKNVMEAAHFLRFIPQFGTMDLSKIHAELSRDQEIRAATNFRNRKDAEFEAYKDEFCAATRAGSPIAIIKVAKRADLLRNEVRMARLPDDLCDWRDRMSDQITEFQRVAMEAAAKAVRL